MLDFTSTNAIDAVAKSLDGLSARHKAIASNIANVDTPHYKRKQVSFERSLDLALHAEDQSRQAMASNDLPLALKANGPEHYSPVENYSSIAAVTPQVHEAADWQYREDGNSVDVETEMTDLAKNTARFNALAEIEKRMIQGIKSVISSSGDGG
ncbi:MAG: flagellar basal body rod protein FlgB [Cyanobacteria bacterium]|nr:flagellar basal body rod protein FlgB [Cyanobacteriota bacterium]